MSDSVPRHEAPERGEIAARSPMAALRRFARAGEVEQTEHCELCGAALPAEHPHLFDRQSGRIACGCPACAILMVNRPDARFIRVPKTVRDLPEFSMSDAQWQSLRVPIDLAFFVVRAGRPAAFYPSPAGATEAPIEPEAWKALVIENPAIASLTPEVEALLVNRLFGQRLYFCAPIDACFELVGLVRVHWRGLSGGTEVWKQVNAFFAGVARRAQTKKADTERAQAKRAEAGRARSEGGRNV